MSGHLIGCAGALKDPRLTSSLKLALVAFADSADDRTHIAFPGYEGVQTWALVSRARAAELIRDLVALGYLEQHKRAHRGRRAEYIVFPGGCCDLHRAPAEEPDIDVERLALAAGVTIDQARRMIATMANPGLDVHPADTTSSTGRNGSDVSDTSSVNESDTSDPLEGGVHETDAKPVENHPQDRERVQRGSDTPDPFTPSSTTSPLPPPASRQGRCPAHPNGHHRCRMCGTTPRQRAKAARLEAEQQQRRAALEQLRADRDRRAALQAKTDPARSASSIRAAKEAAAAAAARKTRGADQ